MPVVPPSGIRKGSLFLAVLLLGMCALAACNTRQTTPETKPTAPAGGSASPTDPVQVSPSAATKPSSRPRLSTRPHILFLGNSHTRRHDVPGTIAAMLRASRPPVRARMAVAPGLLHLNERATDAATQRLLQSRHWDVVVLQAQNYSLSGSTDYPNDGSVSLVRSARKRGAVPILFAEWPRRDVDETEIILDTYRSIGRVAAACLPPIPEAFDLAHAQDPRLRLRASDGNHSSAAGAFLASLILFAAISGEDVASLPDLAIPGVSRLLQRHLRELAAAELIRIPGTRGCPEAP